MIDLLTIGVGVVLLVASIFDLKYRAIPSVFLTGALFLIAVVRIDFIEFGLLAWIFAWTMRDILSLKQLEFGRADIKVMMMIGLMMHTREMFLMFIGVFALFQFVYTLIWTWRFGEDKERPFVPCLLAVYIAMILIGGNM